MSPLSPKIELVPLGNAERFNDLRLLEAETLTLRELLQRAPALSLAPIPEEQMGLLLSNPNLRLVVVYPPPPSTKPLFLPPGLTIEEKQEKISVILPPTNLGEQIPVKTSQFPEGQTYPAVIQEKDAVRWAYTREIEGAASFLRTGLSVLVMCDKLVVEHLWGEIVARANLQGVLLNVAGEDDGGGLMPRSLRQRQLALLKKLIKELKFGDVLVIPHLDLLAGGSDANMPTETRELVELVYESSDRLILAFADRSLDVPEVLAARFAARLLISGVSRTVTFPNGTERPIGQALVTAGEVSHFDGYDPEELYKNVSGLNPIRLRHAIKYARQYAKDNSKNDIIPASQLPQVIRAFKAQTSANFEVPDVSFEDIGGYEEVKAELERAINLISGSYNLPDEKLRRQLIPRGIIFHGPPGTGKTLFAKAIANRLNATVQVVSGPEVMDMYVGESERKVRELFAEARRNAPAVLVFDEFDAIASKREGRGDGGSRAGNAVVAQMLTEMDGFRPDVPMLVIGTTNRLDIIDEALLRPSRFKPVAISLPNPVARRAIAAIHANHFKIQVPPELLDVIATATEGMNGDDIQSLFRDACVGLACEGIPADAHRFGRLVGALRRSLQQRAAGPSERRGSPSQAARTDETPSPSRPMAPMNQDEQKPAESSPNTVESIEINVSFVQPVSKVL